MQVKLWDKISQSPEVNLGIFLRLLEIPRELLTVTHDSRQFRRRQIQ